MEGLMAATKAHTAITTRRQWGVGGEPHGRTRSKVQVRHARRRQQRHSRSGHDTAHNGGAAQPQAVDERGQRSQTRSGSSAAGSSIFPFTMSASTRLPFLALPDRGSAAAKAATSS